jgi:hypothetical protein
MNDPILKNDLRPTHHPLSKHSLPLNTAPSGLLGDLETFAPSSPRRTMHGGCAWSLPSRDRDMALRQPQDGSLKNGGHAAASDMLNALRAGAAARTHADDKLSGATRSLSSRVLGLNGMKVMPEPATAPDTERYFAEHSPLFRTQLLHEGSMRKGPDVSRELPRVPTPQTRVA